MATDFGALSAARKKVWAAQIWEAGRDASFWNMNGFMGDGAGSVIERITELTQTERGNECIMQLVADLTGDGVVGDNRLEDNEESMFNAAISLKIDQLRHGVRSKGAMAEQQLGSPDALQVDIGPVIDAEARDGIARHIGPYADDETHMLSVIGAASRRAGRSRPASARRWPSGCARRPRRPAPRTSCR